MVESIHISLIMREVLERMCVDPSDVQLLVENNSAIPKHLRVIVQDGPWMEEPDAVVWRDPGTGYTLALMRGAAFHLSGYVVVPRGTILDDFDYEEANKRFCISRPVSYTGNSLAFVTITDVDCIVLGFHCAEAWDFVPAVHTEFFYKSLAPGCQRIAPESYKDVAFVAEECRDLASQIRNLTTRYAIG